MGRPKGSPNKANAAVAHILEMKGIDLVEEILKICFVSEDDREHKLDIMREYLQARKTPPDLFLGDKDRATLLLKLMEYVHPKLRSIEVKAEITGNVNLEDNRERLQTIMGDPKNAEAIETICKEIEG